MGEWVIAGNLADTRRTIIGDAHGPGSLAAARESEDMDRPVVVPRIAFGPSREFATVRRANNLANVCTPCPARS